MFVRLSILCALAELELVLQLEVQREIIEEY